VNVHWTVRTARLYQMAIPDRTTWNTLGGGRFLWSNVRLVQTGWLALCGGEVLGQPVSDDLGHADEILTLGELMVGAWHHLQVLLDS
jgi:hypothetical protein